MISSYSNCATMLNATIFADLWANVTYNFHRLDSWRENISFSNLWTARATPGLPPPKSNGSPKKTGVSLGFLCQKPSTGMTSIVLNQVWGATGWCQAWRCRMISLGDKKMVCLVKRELQSEKATFRLRGLCLDVSAMCPGFRKASSCKAVSRGA